MSETLTDCFRGTHSHQCHGDNGGGVLTLALPVPKGFQTETKIRWVITRGDFRTRLVGRHSRSSGTTTRTTPGETPQGVRRPSFVNGVPRSPHSSPVLRCLFVGTGPTHLRRAWVETPRSTRGPRSRGWAGGTAGREPLRLSFRADKTYGVRPSRCH